MSIGLEHLAYSPPLAPTMGRAHSRGGARACAVVPSPQARPTWVAAQPGGAFNTATRSTHLTLFKYNGE